MNSNFPASLKFCKMQGCGNDFILLNGFSQKLPTDGALMGLLAQQICHRSFGVGFSRANIGRADFAQRQPRFATGAGEYGFAAPGPKRNPLQSAGRP